jgi:hypothetical protein
VLDTGIYRDSLDLVLYRPSQGSFRPPVIQVTER